NPESRSFFINVPRPETRYWAELGFYSRPGWWERISASQNTFTPPDAPASEGVVEFATIPVQVTFERVVQTVQNFVTQHQPLLDPVVAAQEAQKKLDAPAPGHEMRSEPPRANGQAQLDEPKQTSRRPSGKRPAIGPSAIPIRIERAHPWTP